MVPGTKQPRQGGVKYDNPQELAAGLARARRWLAAGHDPRGYPTLPPEQETEATLAASPPERAERKPKPKGGFAVLMRHVWLAKRY
jgi:hypothetical protein